MEVCTRGRGWVALLPRMPPTCEWAPTCLSSSSGHLQHIQPEKDQDLSGQRVRQELSSVPVSQHMCKRQTPRQVLWGMGSCVTHKANPLRAHDLLGEIRPAQL